MTAETIRKQGRPVGRIISSPSGPTSIKTPEDVPTPIRASGDVEGRPARQDVRGDEMARHAHSWSGVAQEEGGIANREGPGNAAQSLARPARGPRADRGRRDTRRVAADCAVRR